MRGSVDCYNERLEPFRDERVGLLLKLEELEREVTRLREELARANELAPVNRDAVARRMGEDNAELRRDNQRLHQQLRDETEQVRALRVKIRHLRQSFSPQMLELWKSVTRWFRRD